MKRQECLKTCKLIFMVCYKVRYEREKYEMVKIVEKKVGDIIAVVFRVDGDTCRDFPPRRAELRLCRSGAGSSSE